MKLTDWAKQQGISYLTAWRWCRDGKMPCQWSRTPTGTILVQEAVKSPGADVNTYVYARVSSHNKKEDLARQVARCCAFCEANGWSLSRVFKEAASGMNDKRRQLTKLFDQPPGRLVVEHKDRLTRFGFNYIETLLARLGWSVVVINRDEQDKDDLMKDLVAVITSFCCRLYGLRRGVKKAKELAKDAQSV
jgi:predicted site-specific integrase-resolvase